MNHSETISGVKFFSRKEIPLEMHKVKVVQQLQLVPVERRLQAIQEGGYNSFLLNTRDIFLDMLTDSGTNAMSDEQVSKMFVADDAYAGSQSYDKLEKSIREVLGKKLILPVHQGRAAENIISIAFVKEGSILPMNYHFTTTLAHIQKNGGNVVELYKEEAMKIKSNHPFKGNMDCLRLLELIKKRAGIRFPLYGWKHLQTLLAASLFL